MTKDIRGKVERFLTSEVGRVSVRSPLALGIAGTAFLLSQAIHTLFADPSENSIQCLTDDDCSSGSFCELECLTESESDETCIEWGTACK